MKANVMRDLKVLQLELERKEKEIPELHEIIKAHPSSLAATTYNKRNNQESSCNEQSIRDDENRTCSDTTSSTSVPESIKVENIYPGQRNSSSPIHESIVKIHYTLALESDPDIILEDSRERRQKSGSPPFEFLLGKRQVIPGWETAVKRMTKGEVCRVTISSESAYGAEGLSPSIPPHATLVCRIELIDFHKYERIVRPLIIDTTKNN